MWSARKPGELRDLRETVRRMLKENGAPPAGKWADIAVLEPVRDYKARHASTLLTFDAVVDAIDQIDGKRSDSRKIHRGLAVFRNGASFLAAHSPRMLSARSRAGCGEPRPILRHAGIADPDRGAVIARARGDRWSASGCRRRRRFSAPARKTRWRESRSARAPSTADEPSVSGIALRPIRTLISPSGWRRLAAPASPLLDVGHGIFVRPPRRRRKSARNCRSSRPRP